jgi:hypothetical protein
VIQGTARGQRDSLLREFIRTAFEQQLDLDTRVTAIARKFGKQVDVKRLPEALAKWALESRPTSWRSHLETLVRKQIGQLGDAIDNMVADALADVDFDDDGGRA